VNLTDCVRGAAVPASPHYPKRLFDFAVASMALVVLTPVMIVVALAVWMKLGRPVLFVQDRPGLASRPFRFYKFRTMLPGSASDEDRLTGFGRFLRSTSLDELPGLWNVVRGDMSLVGPRPLLMHYLDHYTPFQMRRHEVRPGVTGWSQVNGRNAVSWQQRFEDDVWYVDNLSFWLDMKILSLTLIKVLTRGGISAEGSATMPPFVEVTKEREHGT
jgi:sugar transferase EpsL